MIRRGLFERYFPLDRAKICQINETDIDDFIKMFRKTEKEIRKEGLHLAHYVEDREDMLLFSAQKYIEIIRGNEKEIMSCDIDIMNMMLYRNKYIFPISCVTKPLLPRKYFLTNSN